MYIVTIRERILKTIKQLNNFIRASRKEETKLYFLLVQINLLNCFLNPLPDDPNHFQGTAGITLDKNPWEYYCVFRAPVMLPPTTSLPVRTAIALEDEG